MNEKKTLKKKGVLATAVVAGVLLAGGIGFGIFNNQSDDNGAVAKPTASAMPSTSAPEDLKEETIANPPNDGSVADPRGEFAGLTATPFGLSEAEIMSKSLNDDVLAQYPEAEFKVSDGIMNALQHYYITWSVSDFYHARDGIGTDMTIAEPINMGGENLIDIESNLSNRIIKELTETGKTGALWTVPASGIVQHNGVEYKVADNAEVSNLDVGRPVVMISNEGTALVIKSDGLLTDARNKRVADIKATGKSDIQGFGMIFTLPLENGKFYHVSLAFYMEITPGENGKWTITEMGYEDMASFVNSSATWKGSND